MRLLHTSDWHLGRALHGRRREAEFAAFLDWLIDCIERERVDVLLVAGDIFDTTTPSHAAQELYYRFLWRVANSHCRHLVIIAGNHDSPSFLEAPRELLRALDIHVRASLDSDPTDQVLCLADQQGATELILCAVPYPRERDLRLVEAGEDAEDKERKLIAAIQAHYGRVFAEAERARAALGRWVPVVATGHLFVRGGQTLDGDGVRSLYVGSLSAVGADLFPDWLDYVGLGHLHVPQTIQRHEQRRYSGSPLPMGFGEARHTKEVCLVEFEAGETRVRPLPLPCFQPLESIQGDWRAIAARLAELVASESAAWLEIVHEGEELIGDLRERLDQAIAGSPLEILRIRAPRPLAGALEPEQIGEQLADLGPEEVFARCLEVSQITEEQRPVLLRAHREILAALHEHDPRAN
ncbi:MAG: exonuclease SbcCD subunit D C-terminal domain-containing protein [Chromatiaceae bacterium]|nr:exonuclease SbcCD subunit D C-terminal domain-containing protein [Chromatiaceae bacterium]